MGEKKERRGPRATPQPKNDDSGFLLQLVSIPIITFTLPGDCDIGGGGGGILLQGIVPAWVCTCVNLLLGLTNPLAYCHGRVHYPGGLLDSH